MKTVLALLVIVGISLVYIPHAYSACTELEVHNETWGKITSPGYPETYENDLYCEWLIEVDKNSTVYLTFLDFRTESGVDYITVYDGNSSHSPVLLIHSGDGPVPMPLSSFRNSLFITFVTDYRTTNKGFTANYLARNNAQD